MKKMIGGLVVGLFVLIFFWQLYSLNKEEIEYKITDSESIENKISQNKDLNIYFLKKVANHVMYKKKT